MEQSSAERLYRVARMLHDSPLTIRQIVLNLAPGLSRQADRKQWNALERNVQRDLELLAGLEDRFEILSGRPRRHVIHTQRQSLQAIETLALHAAARLVYHRSPGHNKHHRQALAQIARWLPERVRPVVERSVADVGKRRSREDSRLEDAASAWFGGHPLRFEYRSVGGSGQWRTNELEIYLIEVHPVNLDLYAIGREVSFHQAMRTFKLSRMRGLSVMRDRTYQIPADFEPKTYFQNAWGVVGSSETEGVTVTLRFASEVAYRIDEGGYANLGQPLRHADGSIEIEVRAGVDHSGLPRELMPWILGWGPRVEVLEPLHVRDHWLREVRETLGRYGGNTV